MIQPVGRHLHFDRRDFGIKPQQFIDLGADAQVAARGGAAGAYDDCHHLVVVQNDIHAIARPSQGFDIFISAWGGQVFGPQYLSNSLKRFPLPGVAGPLVFGAAEFGDHVVSGQTDFQTRSSLVNTVGGMPQTDGAKPPPSTEHGQGGGHNKRLLAWRAFNRRGGWARAPGRRLAESGVASAATGWFPANAGKRRWPRRLSSGS